MHPYLQEILHQISVKVAKLERQNKNLEAECAALREQIMELEHDRNLN